MRKRNPFKVTALAAAVATTTLLPLSGLAYETSIGEVNLQIDTTLSVGFGWRASDIDYEGVGPENARAAGKDVEFDTSKAQYKNAHKHGTGSQDNSNLRYEQGETYSELVKGSVDLDFTYRDYGAFFRARFWYDNRIMNGDGGSDAPAFWAGADTAPDYAVMEPDQDLGAGAEFLDAFVWGDWWLGDMPLNVRLGQQVISWGEGVFFPNGINTINPVDVNALLAPGSAIKEALIPIQALYGSIGVNENLSIEAFYQFKWEETRLPGCGTYFSTTDLVGYEGCVNGFYSLGGDTGSTVSLLGLDFSAEDFRLPRGDDIEGDDSGQYGLAARFYVESLEMELAAYYIRYNSRLPLLSGYTPDIGNDGITIASVTNPADPLLVLPGSIYNSDTALVDIRDALALSGSPLATAFLLPYAQYVVEYPDDIQLYGVSMNTTFDFGLPGGATSVSAELSMRQDQPFQIEDGVLLAGLVGFPSQICEDASREYDCYAQGAFEQNEYVAGYIRENYYQGEIAFIHFFDQILGANRWTTVVDLGFSYADVPGNDEILLNSSYNASLASKYFPQTDWFATDLSDRETAGQAGIAYEEDYYPDDFAWGYKLRFTGDYANIFAGINMVPTISFSHDVSGTTPSPITNFLEDRMALGLSAEFIYLNMYSVKIGYTDFFGAEPYNQLADRDNYTLSASVSF